MRRGRSGAGAAACCHYDARPSGLLRTLTVYGLTIMDDPASILAFLILASFGGLLWFRLGSALRQTRELQLLVAKLTARVYELEQRGVAVPIPEPAPAPAPSAEIHVVSSSEPAAAAAPSPATREDWETRLGTNWLNRLGALLLVIGIALFVGYSLTQLGPGGKVAIGTVLGVALLGAGIALEPREQWRTYAWSLMGAGWAVVYFTAYAAHAVPAARVIDNPAVATVLLMAVSAAMIGHSLRYRSEPATALAYLLGFVGLNVSPVTSFSVTATLILALSLIALAWRFDWFRLPLLGSVLVYLTFVIRYDPAVHTQTVLWTYWLAFEAWDLLRGRRRAVFLVNFAGFTGASLLHGMRTRLEDWLPFCLAAAAAYLISAVIRYRSPERRDEGGYELAACASAVMLGGGLIDRFTGPTLTFALLFEAEMIVLAGFALGSRFLQNAGSVALLAAIVHLVVDAVGGSRWTPAATAIAAVLLLNRWLLKAGWYFTGAAGVLMAFVIWDELPTRWIAPVAAAAGAIAFRVPLRDFRWTGVMLLAVAWLGAMVNNVQALDTLGVALVLAALYSANWMPSQIAATLLATVFLYNKVPSRMLALSWAGEAAALLAAGFPLGDRTLRLSGLAVFLLCLIRLFAWDLRGLDTPARILSFVVLGIVLLAASFVYTRRRRA